MWKWICYAILAEYYPSTSNTTRTCLNWKHLIGFFRNSESLDHCANVTVFEHWGSSSLGSSWFWWHWQHRTQLSIVPSSVGSYNSKSLSLKKLRVGLKMSSFVTLSCRGFSEGFLKTEILLFIRKEVFEKSGLKKHGLKWTVWRDEEFAEDSKDHHLVSYLLFVASKCQSRKQFKLPVAQEVRMMLMSFF